MFLAIFFFFVGDGSTSCWTCDDRGRRERWKKIKVEGVDDSVTTWLMSQCLEQGGGRGGGVVVVVGVKMLRWSWQCKRWDGAMLGAGGRGVGWEGSFTGVPPHWPASGCSFPRTPRFHPPPTSPSIFSFTPFSPFFYRCPFFPLFFLILSLEADNKRRSWWQTEEWVCEATRRVARSIHFRKPPLCLAFPREKETVKDIYPILFFFFCLRGRSCEVGGRMGDGVEGVGADGGVFRYMTGKNDMGMFSILLC